MSTKYNRTFHLPISPGTTSDDRIAKSVDNLLNRMLILGEKLDGENQGLNRPGVYARSHGAFTQNPWSVKSWELHQRIGRDIPEDMFIFGENMYAIHSIEYHNLKSYFYMFGIRDKNTWLSWDEMEEYAYLLDIPMVPVLYKGVFSTAKELYDKVEELVKQPSRLGSDVMEGCVVRVADSFDDSEFSTSVMKWVRKGHVQTDEHWTRNWKKAKINYV